MSFQRQEIASRAAALIVEEGMGYGPAKKQAAAQLGYGNGRADWPDADQLLAAVRDHIAIFCPETQAQELAVLRQLAFTWMDRLASFHPVVVGAVWNGTATQHSDIHLELYCEDTKEAQIFLLNKGLRFDETSTTNAKGAEVPVFVLALDVLGWQQKVMLLLTVLDRDDLRHAPGSRPKGADQLPLRGDRAALERQMRAAAR